MTSLDPTPERLRRDLEYLLRNKEGVNVKMTCYLIRSDPGGAVLGVYVGATPEAAVRAMFADADDPGAEADAGLRADPVSCRADCERLAGEAGGEAWDRYVETRTTE